MQKNYPKILQKNSPYGIVQYETMQFLGSGGFAECFLVTRLNDDKLFAAKITSKKKMSTRKNMESRLRCEIEIMKRLKHHNIVRYEDSFEDDEFVYIIMEYCEKISLYEMLRKRQTLTEYEIKYFLRQLMLGLMYLKQNCIIHRDIKICNVMLNSKLQIKIGDFGLATYWNEKSHDKQPTICGTPNYMSPEVIRKVPYSFEVDIWSSGVLMFNLRFGRCPFTGTDQKETYQNILKLKYTFPEHQITSSKNFKNLIRKMLHPSQKQRITLEQILSHDFLKENIPPQLPRSCYSKCPTQRAMNKLMEDIKLKKCFAKMKERQMAEHLNTPSTHQKKQPSLLKMKHQVAILDSQEVKLENIQIINNKDSRFNYINLAKLVYVKQFTDNSSQFGFYFHLSNNMSGILFNDKSSMYLNNKSKEVYFKENQEYKRKRLKYTAIKEKQYPIFWRKVLTLKCYSKKSTRDCSINEMKPEMSIEQTLRTMRSWARVCDTYMFSLRNIVQVIFEDHSTIIYVMDENTLLYLQREKIKCYLPPFEDFKEEGHKNKLKVFENFYKIVLQKRNFGEESE